MINAEVQFSKGEVVVQYDNAKTDPAKIAAGLSEATNGRYKATPKS